MFVHIRFEDGSKSWVRFGLRTMGDVEQTIAEWEKAYDIEQVGVGDCGFYFVAKAKTRINNHREFRYCFKSVLAN